MIYYVIKKTRKITQAQLNACGARDKKFLRKTKLGRWSVIKFDEKDKQSFIHDKWLTKEEADKALSLIQWQERKAPIWSRIRAFFMALLK